LKSDTDESLNYWLVDFLYSPPDQREWFSIGIRPGGGHLMGAGPHAFRPSAYVVRGAVV